MSEEEREANRLECLLFLRLFTEQSGSLLSLEPPLLRRRDG